MRRLFFLYLHMSYAVQPIALVSNTRKDPGDDAWGSILFEIHLTDSVSEDALAGIEDFSHLEIFYIFHQATSATIVWTAEHPRENPDLPKVCIFAQRKKNRPNHIGSTIVELVEVKGRTLTVKNLDAIDGTPVIDIKPVMKEFLPLSEVRQPEWSVELMKNYW